MAYVLGTCTYVLLLFFGNKINGLDNTCRASIVLYIIGIIAINVVTYFLIQYNITIESMFPH